MLLILAAAAFSVTRPAPVRSERLMALARLDAAVHYFDPAVATRASSWDSLFAANALRIVDARDSREYAGLVYSLLRALPADTSTGGSTGRALVYDGFPTVLMQSSGGYSLRWRSAPITERYRVDMGEGVVVDVPIAEAKSDTTETPSPAVLPDRANWRAAYPSTGYRILAAARVWSTIRLFYPYKPLIGESWDDQLRAALPEFEGARDPLEYAQAVARFAWHIHDTHVTVDSRALYEWIGFVPIGAAARLIEDQVVVTRIADSRASRAGLRVGDVVLSVDGEPTARRIARLTPFLPVSTPQSLHYRLASSLLAGRDTTPARLEVRGADGATRTVVVPRSRTFASLLQHHRTGNIIRILPGNIGYVDLDRLPTTMVDSAFRVLAGTKAMVLDDRGYPLGTVWSIAPRLNVHAEPTVAAKFRRLVVPSPDTARTTVFDFDQPIPPALGVARYTGRTVLLVDERTISQAEHTGLFFEAANGTEVVGSPSMGANGDITVLPIPGAIAITFSGHDVRHADGRQLQRVGLQPQLRVTPTIAGIRSGRDEVLEAALRYLGGTGEIPPDTIREPARAIVSALPNEPPAIGWLVHASAPGNYRLGVDRSVAHGGMSSGHITARTDAPEEFATLTQAIGAGDYRGKRVRFSAFVRSRAVTGGAQLWLRVDGNGGMMAFDNMGRRAITGTTEWTRVSVVLDVPSDASGLALGFLLQGGGEGWVDDAALEVVGSDVPTTNMMTEPTSDAAGADAMRRQYATAALTLANPGFEAW
jgi:Periplasmic protease